MGSGQPEKAWPSHLAGEVEAGMSEQDRKHIRENLKLLAEAIARQDEKPPVDAFMALLERALTDLNRVADAVEHIGRTSSK